MRVVAGLVCAFLLVCLVYCAPAEDQIKLLPGLSDEIHFKQYSGYLNASEGKFLHYWFVQSERSIKDPLLLWLNGGPGCSSLFGHLGEHGPIHVNKDGKTLYINPYRWNKIANVLYLEAPAGVGFSYSISRNYTINDDQVADDNYLALKSFFAKFPEYQSNDFYVTGESYGGVYVPTLSYRVLTGSLPLRFKGFAVGNGISDWSMNGNSLIFFGYYHGLFGETTWDSLVKYCCSGSPTRNSCDFSNSQNPLCQKAVSDASSLVSSPELDMYNLYADCAQAPSANKTALRNTRRAFDSRIIPYSLGLTNTLHPLKEVIPCVDDSNVANWLNQASVREALHIPDDVQAWEECSSAVAGSYISTYQTLKPVYQKLLASNKLRALIYNGDVDMACNFLGDQWFVEDLNLPVLSSYQEWHYNKQVAGYLKKFKKLSLITIKGSGHMVPQDKPGQAYKMIDEFLKGNI